MWYRRFHRKFLKKIQFVELNQRHFWNCFLLLAEHSHIFVIHTVAHLVLNVNFQQVFRGEFFCAVGRREKWGQVVNCVKAGHAQHQASRQSGAEPDVNINAEGRDFLLKDESDDGSCFDLNYFQKGVRRLFAGRGAICGSREEKRLD